MSDLHQIEIALNPLFSEEGQRIVFWNDPDRDFFAMLPVLKRDGLPARRPGEVATSRSVQE